VPRGTSSAEQSIGCGSAQYRNRYAEPESAVAALCPDSFDAVMVVPVCAESAAFVGGYRAAAQGAESVLGIAVLNGRVDAGESVHALNARCLTEVLRTVSDPVGAAASSSRLVRWIPHVETDASSVGLRGAIATLARGDPESLIHR